MPSLGGKLREMTDEDNAFPFKAAEYVSLLQISLCISSSILCITDFVILFTPFF